MVTQINDSKMKLSIVIPVYNAEDSIVKCVESITNQESNWTSIEILLCNDGSTDSSILRLDELAEKHDTITVFHLENQGVYKTRNFALTKITGDYVWMLDSDDFISDNALELLFKIVEQKQIDVVHFGYFEQLSNGNTIKVLPPINEGVINGFSFLEKNDGRLFLWNNMYSTQFLNQNQIRFLAKSVSLEDSLFNLTVFTKAKTIKYLHEALYTYCYNPNSISKKRNTAHILKLGESSKNVHLGTKELRDTFVTNSLEYNIVNERLMHSVQGFFYSLLMLKYPLVYIKHIFKLYESEKLIPLRKKNKNIKLKIFQQMINSKFPFLWLCKINQQL